MILLRITNSELNLKLTNLGKIDNKIVPLVKTCLPSILDSFHNRKAKKTRKSQVFFLLKIPRFVLKD